MAMRVCLVLLVFFVPTQGVIARELLEFNSIKFGDPLDVATDLVGSKNGFELWTKKDSSTERHIKFDLNLLGGLSFKARAFFEQGKAAGFNISSDRFNMDKEACQSLNEAVVDAIREKYGSPTLSPVIIGNRAPITQYVAYFGFDNARHIEIYTNFDGVIPEMSSCNALVTYKDEPIPESAIEESRNAKSVEKDSF